MTKRRRRKQKTERIYYGANKYTGKKFYWTVRVVDARAPVSFRGTLADALAGHAGLTIGCHLSQAAQRNGKLFPHSFEFASFTKSTCLVVDKIVNGQPKHAVRYAHSLGRYVELNDIDKKKEFIKANPELAEQEFTLRIPRPARPGQGGGGDTGDGPKKGGFIIPRGALARAANAGLVNPGLEDILTDDADEMAT